MYYCALKAGPSSPKVLLRNLQNVKQKVHFFNIDNELLYWNFFLDFGPLNLGQLYRFCTRLNEKLDDNSYDLLVFYSSTAPAKRANAIFLICAWQVLHLNRSPEEAYHGFSFYNNEHYGEGGDGDHHEHHPHHNQQQQQQQHRDANAAATTGSIANDLDRHRRINIQSCSSPPPYPLTTIGKNTIAPLPPFHDASPCACTYELNILHCLQGLQKAREFRFFDWNTFDVEEYEFYEQVEVCSVFISSTYMMTVKLQSMKNTE